MFGQTSSRETLWDMPAKPPPSGFEEIQHVETARLFGRVVWTRMIIAPAMGLIALGGGLYESAPWRCALLFVGVLAVVGISALEVRRYRNRGLAPGAVDFNIGLGVSGHLIVTSATGGLESPVLPLLLPIAVFVGLTVRKPKLRRLYIGAQLLATWVLALIAVYELVPTFNLDLLGGGPRAGHSDAMILTAAAVLTGGLALAVTMGKNMRAALDAMLIRALEARDDSLRAHAERARELTSLSGEIAHELKNPLASVKGLAALLSRDVTEGKNAERLLVLRDEVDRMQGILEEFLNFSRPLVPLSLERTELQTLAGDVVLLHEGIGRERRLALEIGGARVQARCDVRKIKQVLINLVQNALDAAAPGTSVQLETGQVAEQVFVRVMDRGPGLEPSLGERAFEAGVTTKAKGSGLGLTIARAIARQHGGDLVLSPRDGGGCVAEVRLPVEGPAAPAQEAIA